MTCVDLRLPACALLAVTLPAWAALGGDASSIEQDRARLGARHEVVALAAPTSAAAGPATFQAHRLVMADGGTIVEYAAADGRVFAIRWHTRLKPRLDALLGAEAAAVYAGAARRARATPGPRHAFTVDESDLVVQATTRLDAQAGLAYRRSWLPAGLSPDALR